MDEIAAAAELMVPALPAVEEIEAAVQAAAVVVAESEIKSEPDSDKPKRIHRAKALTPKQAYTKFWNRGIFVIYNEDLDLETDDEELKHSKYIVRCRCSPACKTSFATWDNYAYTRHFTYKRHEKWENNRGAQGWDEGEAYRDFVKFIESTMEDSEGEEVEEPKKKRGRKSKKDSTPKVKTEPKGSSRQEERRNQEMHHMNLWREARLELKVMRQELKEEQNEEAAEELRGDIAGLKKKKEEWAKLLGIEGCDV